MLRDVRDDIDVDVETGTGSERSRDISELKTTNILA